MKNIAIVTDTPYQVMNAINLKTCNSLFCNEYVDLYIVHQFKDSKMISDLIKENNIFANVYDLDPRLQNEEENIFFRIFDILFPKHGLKGLLKSTNNNVFKIKYDIILFSWFTKISKMLLLCNNSAEIYLFDDGTASYSRNLKPDSLIPANHAFLYRLLGYNIVNPSFVKGIFLNNPDFYSGVEFDNILCIKDKSCDNAKVLNDVFYLSNPKKYLDNKIIYFTTPENENDSILCNYIIRKVDGVLVRFHPRQNTDSYQMYNGDKDYGEGLWELICSSYISDNHILIGSYSTAQLTPFMLFGKQPYLIFAYKLFSDLITNELEEAIEKMIKTIKEKYQNKEKICIAHNEEEIIEFIQKVNNGAV